jgi:hypothetical protein
MSTWEADALPLGYTRKIDRIYLTLAIHLVHGKALIFNTLETLYYSAPQFFRGIIPYS